MSAGRGTRATWSWRSPNLKGRAATLRPRSPAAASPTSGRTGSTARTRRPSQCPASQPSRRDTNGTGVLSFPFKSSYDYEKFTTKHNTIIKNKASIVKMLSFPWNLCRFDFKIQLCYNSVPDSIKYIFSLDIIIIIIYRRLSDPSATIDTWLRGGWKSKSGNR